jgi:hypothetical protein
VSNTEWATLAMMVVLISFGFMLGCVAACLVFTHSNHPLLLLGLGAGFTGVVSVVYGRYCFKWAGKEE